MGAKGLTAADHTARNIGCQSQELAVGPLREIEGRDVEEHVTAREQRLPMACDQAKRCCRLAETSRHLEGEGCTFPLRRFRNGRGRGNEPADDLVELFSRFGGAVP